MRILLYLFGLLTSYAAFSQSSTLFTVPTNGEHEGAIMRHTDGSVNIQTFFKLSRASEVQMIETVVEVDSNSFILIGKFTHRLAYSLILFDSDLNHFQEVHSFDSLSPVDFSDDLYIDQNGNCLGVVLNGALTDSGFVFSYSLATNVFSQVAVLDKNTVSNLSRSFAFNQDSNVLYGMSSKGGVGNCGFIFSVELNGNGITEIFQINLISSVPLFAKHLDYKSGIGLFGYLESSSNRHLLFRLKNNFFTLIRDFDVAVERPVGSVCVIKDMFVGTSFDVINQRQLIYKLDSNGSNREFISVNQDTAWGASNNRSILPLNDSTVLFCTYNGGQFNSGALLKVDINSFKITPVLSFSSTTGFGPFRMQYSLSTNQVHVHLSKGASGNRGAILSVNLMNNEYSQRDLLGMPFGATISNAIVEIANKKILYISESGGLNGKGALGLIDFYSRNLDTVVSFGGESVYNDSAYQTPDISSLHSVNDTLVVFNFKSGGPHLRGGMAFFSTKSGTLSKVIDFSTKENQTPIGRISLNNSGSLLTWTNLDYPSHLIYKLLKVSANQGTVDTLISFNSFGFFEFRDKQILSEGTNLYIPYIGFQSPFGGPMNPDGLAKFDGTDFDYIEFPYYNFGKLIGTNILKVEKDKIAFIMTSDVDFGFGKLILYDVNTRASEIFPYFDLTMQVRPVGGIYHDNFDNSIYTLASKYGDYGLGGLMKFDLYSRTFSTMVDFGNNPDFSSIVNYSPQITRVHPFPLGSEPLSRRIEGRLAIYPNPGNGTFYINSEIAVDIEIYTIQGSLIHSAREVIPGSPVSITGVPKGIYFVRIDGESEMNKLIVH